MIDMKANTKIILISMFLLALSIKNVYAYSYAGEDLGIDEISKGAVSDWLNSAQFSNWVESDQWYLESGVDTKNITSYFNYTYDILQVESIHYSFWDNYGLMSPSGAYNINATLKQWNYTSSAWVTVDLYEFTQTVPSVGATCHQIDIDVYTTSDFINGTNYMRFQQLLNFYNDTDVNDAVGTSFSCDGWNSGTTIVALVEYNFVPLYELDGDCSFGDMVLNITAQDEEDDSYLTFDIDYDFDIENGDGSFEENVSLEGRNNDSYQICIYPGNESYYITGISNYWDDGYSERYYYLENASVISPGTELSLYLLNESDSTQVTMQVLDQAESPEDDVIIQVQKYKIGEGVYDLVAEGKTDFSGYAYINLELGEIYKFFLIRDGNILREYEPMQLQTTSLVFYISTVDIPEYFDYYDKVATSCIFSNTTLNLTCSYTDTSGLTMEMDFTVDRLDQAGYTNVCSENSSSSSGSFVCSLADNRSYKYSMIGEYQEETYIWEQGFLSLGEDVVNFGSVGILMAFILVSISGLISFYDIKASLIATAFSLIFSIMTGLILVGVETITMMISIAFIFMLVAFKVKS